MGIFDIFKKKQKDTLIQDADLGQVVNFPKQAETETILTKELESLFPTTGRWGRSCYTRSTELEKRFLPCHLYNTTWIAKLMSNQLLDKGYVISDSTIKKFLDSSETFQKLRHYYEQEIVKWQIDFMRNDGEGFLIPNGYDEMSFLTDPNVAELFRASVIKTLTAIGLNESAVEEGLERNSDMWLESYLKKGFSNAFEPVMYYYGQPMPVDECFRENWLKLKKHQYYSKHKDVVEKFNDNAENMKLAYEEVRYLYQVVPAQSVLRRQQIDAWKKYTGVEESYGQPHSFDDDESSF